MSGPYITAQNAEIVGFIATHQPVRLGQLVLRFPQIGTAARISARICYLRAQGWLLREGSTTRAVWFANQAQPVGLNNIMTPGVRGSLAKQARPAKKKDDPIQIDGAVVAPRQIDLMHGNAYQPKPHTPARAGANQFLACPTVGVRC